MFGQNGIKPVGEITRVENIDEIGRVPIVDESKVGQVDIGNQGNFKVEETGKPAEDPDKPVEKSQEELAAQAAESSADKAKETKAEDDPDKFEVETDQNTKNVELEEAFTISQSSYINEEMGYEIGTEFESTEDMLRSFEQEVIAKNSKEGGPLYDVMYNRVKEDLGVTDRFVEERRQSFMGVDPREIDSIRQIKRLVKNADISDEANRKEIFRIGHEIAGLSPEKAESYASRDLVSADADKLLETSIDVINGYVDTEEKNFMNTYNASKEKYETHQASERQKTDKLLRSGNIGDKKYTREDIQSYIDAKMKKTEEYDDPVFGTRKVSLLDKLSLETSLEKRLAQEIDMVLAVKNPKKGEKKKEKAKRGSIIEGVSKLTGTKVNLKNMGGPPQSTSTSAEANPSGADFISTPKTIKA